MPKIDTKALAENKGKTTDPTNIIPLKRIDDFTIQDFLRSGINKPTINEYVDGGYLFSTAEYWQLIYPDISANQKTDYYTRRIKTPKGKNKYIKPSGMSSRLFRPLALSFETFSNPNNYIIIVEGEKKAIKGVQEGFCVISIGGVWCWKQRPKTKDKDDEEKVLTEEDFLTADIIPEIAEANFEGKTIFLCFDNDVWAKEQVSNALYQFSAYLIKEKKAIVKIIYLPKSKEKIGLDDYLIKYGKDAFQKLIDNAETLTLKIVQTRLTGNLDKTLKFPIEIFEGDLKDKLIELHQRHDAPLEYIASALIAFCSVFMNGIFSIIVDKTKNWKDDPIIWIAMLGTPSQKKTPVSNIYKKLVDEYDAYLNKEFEQAQELYKFEIQTYKAEMKKFENGKTTEAPTPPVEPQKQRLTTQNITVEALIRLVEKNSKGIKRAISIVVDELTTLLKGLGQYKNGGNNDAEYFLQAWRKQVINTVRSTRDIDITSTVSHCIIGTIQPKALKDTLFKDGIDSTNGMIERWLFASSKYEEGNVIYTGNKPYNISLIKDIFDKLYAVKDERTYCFSPTAQKCFNDFCTYIIQRKKSDRISDLMKNYLQKQTDYAARFSLILNCIENPDRLEIPDSIVQKALKLCAYFINTFEDIIIREFNSIPLCDYALNYIISKDIKTISPTQLYKSNTSRYRSRENASITLEILANRGYGRLVKVKNNGVKFISYCC